MKKNSLELKKRQHEMLIEQERKERERREKRLAAKNVEVKQTDEEGEVEMKSKKKSRNTRSLPRRDYKANRRQARLAKYAPRLISSDSGDIDMAEMSKQKRVIPVSKTLRLVKDKETSIRK